MHKCPKHNTVERVERHKINSALLKFMIKSDGTCTGIKNPEYKYI